MTPLVGINVSSLLTNVTITPADPDPYPSVTTSSWVAFFVVGIPIFLTLIAASGLKFAENQMAKNALRDKDAYVELEDGQKGDKRKSFVSKLLECWAIQDTFKQLFYPEVNPKHDTNLHVFNGVRFLSILWVLLGHQYLYRASFITNYIEIPLILDDTILNFVAAGFFSVDTFFFLSGFL